MEENNMEVQHKIVMSQVMLPHQANVAGNVHGGEIMKFMDMAAAAVAMKFSKGNCVTARVAEERREIIKQRKAEKKAAAICKIGQ